MQLGSRLFSPNLSQYSAASTATYTREQLTHVIKQNKAYQQKQTKQRELTIKADELALEETPLFTAIRHPYSGKSVAACLAEGHDINHRNRLGQTPLHIACELAKGFYLNDPPAFPSPTDACPRSKNILELLDHGADVNAQCKNGITALHIAAQYRRPDLAKALLDKGADPSLETNRHQSPLYLACCDGETEAEQGILRRDTDYPEYTRLRWVDTEVTQVLLSHDETITADRLITPEIYKRFLFSGHINYFTGQRTLSPNFIRLWQAITQSGHDVLLALRDDQEHITVQKFKEATQSYTAFEWAIFHNDQPIINALLQSDTLRDLETRQAFFDRHRQLCKRRETSAILQQVYPVANDLSLLKTDTSEEKFKKVVSAIARIRNINFVDTGIQLEFQPTLIFPHSPPPFLSEAAIDEIATLFHLGTQKWSEGLATELHERGLYSSLFSKESRTTLQSRALFLGVHGPSLTTKDEVYVARDVWGHAFTFLVPEDQYGFGPLSK